MSNMTCVQQPCVHSVVCRSAVLGERDLVVKSKQVESPGQADHTDSDTPVLDCALTGHSLHSHEIHTSELRRFAALLARNLSHRSACTNFQVVHRLTALEQGQAAPHQMSRQLAAAMTMMQTSQERLERQLTDQAVQLKTLMETMARFNTDRNHGADGPLLTTSEQ